MDVTKTFDDLLIKHGPYRRGFLVVDSHPGKCTDRQEERAYISGYISNHLLDPFVRNLIQSAETVVLVWGMNDRPQTPAVHSLLDLGTLPDFWDPTLPIGARISLRKTRGPDGVWAQGVGIPLSTPVDYFAAHVRGKKTYKQILQSSATLLTVVSVRRCNPDLTRLLTKAMDGLVDLIEP